MKKRLIHILFAFKSIKKLYLTTCLAGLSLLEADLSLAQQAEIINLVTIAPENLTLQLPEMFPTETMRPTLPASSEISVRRTFLDEFDVLDPNIGPWQTFSRNDPNSFEQRTRADNEEQQLYVDTAFKGTGDTPLGLNPFTIENSILRIRGSRAESSVLPFLNGFEYLSGQLSTENRFQQKYGYFETRMKPPDGQGVWSAFWLMMDFDMRPEGRAAWPPEIDVIEFIGRESDVYHVTSHWNIWPDQQRSGDAVTVIAPTKSFNLYGVLWTPEYIVFYLNRMPVRYISTKANQHTPMFMIINLALGGRWPGPVLERELPADLMVDWIAAWQLSP